MKTDFCQFTQKKRESGVFDIPLHALMDGEELPDRLLETLSGAYTRLSEKSLTARAQPADELRPVLERFFSKRDVTTILKEDGALAMVEKMRTLRASAEVRA